ncbi:uncharacterized protein LOC125031862 [Penaeus chinensis]|uniref:Carcinin-like protein n=1 Tax=Penaeus chinensis TaxID=139456 RepID=D6BP34_PENCE|nr:uncharacterized protein LOC125031862 [Penaeus chinensis]ACD11038.1 carcinin-like protein [Penaeus chinensis]ACZ43783.1 crustin 3 [Penaeus chinensis]QOL09977.1 type Ib crustin cruIb-2 [Penaeus chinensis]
MQQVLYSALLWACLWNGVRSSPIYATEVTPASKCVYWCKTPDFKFYCCDNDGETFDPEELEHDGQCPQVRRECPGKYKNLPSILPDFDDNGVPYPDNPKFCAHDSACNAWEKCCYDHCFERHVCKFAYSSGTNIEYSENPFREGDIFQETTYLS